MFGTTKKKIRVSSTVYNMAGEFDPRQTFTKATILSSVLKNSNLSSDIVNSVLFGTYSQKSKFFRWANNNDYKGNIISGINRQKEVDLDVVISNITVPVGQQLYVNKAIIEIADTTYFAEKYILDNYPELRYTAWIVEQYTPLSVIITYEDLSTEIVDLPLDFNQNSNYLVVYYDFYKDPYDEPLVEGAIITDTVIPDTSEYDTIIDTVTSTDTVTLTTSIHILREYSNSDPDVEEDFSSDHTEDFDNTHIEKTFVEYLGNTVDKTLSTKTHFYYEDKTYFIDSSVEEVVEIIDHGTYTETKTTTTTTEFLANEYTYKEDYQITNSNEFVSSNILLYRLGSNEIMDYESFVDTTTTFINEFYPIVPLRINNTSVRDLDLYSITKTAYKKLTSKQGLDDILDTIEDNPSISHIDYSYIHLGISLNTKSKKDKKYIYRFFKNLIPYQTYTKEVYDNWLETNLNNATYEEVFNIWFNAQSDPENILFGTAKPINPNSLNQAISAYTPSTNKLELKTDNTFNDNFKVVLVWNYIDEELLSGLGKPTAIAGDYWLDYPVVTEGEKAWGTIYTTGSDLSSIGHVVGIDKHYIYLYHQISDTTYSRITVSGLEYRNYVYKNKYVHIIAREALLDEEQSGFTIPLHIPTLKSMSALDRNDIVLNSHQLIFNTIQVLKTRWYQSTAFKVILIIAIIVIAIITGGGGAALFSGLAETGSAIAGVIGITGLGLVIYAIIGLAANLLIGIVLNYILTKLFSLVFDERIAGLLAAITTIVITSGTSITSSGEVVFTAGSLVSTLTIMKLTIATLDGLITYISDIPTLIAETNELAKRYNQLEEDIEKGNSLLGTTSYKEEAVQNLILQNKLNLSYETPNEFLSRTLSSGSEIIEVGRKCITDFVDLSLKLEY